MLKSPTKAVPEAKTLFISGYTANVVRHGILDQNINFLQKPFTIQSLLAMVQRILNNPGTNRSGP